MDLVLFRNWQRVLLLMFFIVQLLAAAPAHSEDYNQFKLDLMLAERGDTGAQFSVGSAYEDGNGVKKDLMQAFQWFSMAAKNKHSGAQFKLGEFYEKGLGVKKNQAKADAWYKQAEENGSRLAKKHRAQIETEKQVAMKEKSNRELAAQKKKEQERKKLAKERERRLAAEKARRDKKLSQAESKKKLTAKVVPVSKKMTAEEKATVISKHSKLILSLRWNSKSNAASLLPSSVNNCLESSDNEIVCFSKKQRKTIAHSDVVYTTKSTLKDFSVNGDFVLSYYFNVLEINKTTDAGVSVDSLGLMVKNGWQEPELKISCNIHNKKIKCVGRGNTFYYRP